MKQLLKTMSDEIAQIMKLCLEDDDIAENIKVGKNTLKDSNLYKSIETRINSPFIELVINDYYRYVSNGRERHHTPRVPIDALRDWARRKLHKTDNGTLFAVQQSIYEYGIRPRPIFHHFWKNIDKQWDEKWASEIFDKLSQDIIKYFK